MDTLKDIEAFIVNANRLGEDEVVAMAYTRRAELVRDNYEATGRRPDINYLEIGLHVGDTITHMRSGEKATIRTDRTLTFRGLEDYITNIESLLITEMDRGSGSKSNKYSKKTWMTDDGKTLDELYLKTYVAKR